MAKLPEILKRFSKKDDQEARTIRVGEKTIVVSGANILQESPYETPIDAHHGERRKEYAALAAQVGAGVAGVVFLASAISEARRGNLTVIEGVKDAAGAVLAFTAAGAKETLRSIRKRKHKGKIDVYNSQPELAQRQESQKDPQVSSSNSPEV